CSAGFSAAHSRVLKLRTRHYHNPKRERGNDLRRFHGICAWSLAYASGCEKHCESRLLRSVVSETRNFKTYASGCERHCESRLLRSMISEMGNFKTHASGRDGNTLCGNCGNRDELHQKISGWALASADTESSGKPAHSK